MEETTRSIVRQALFALNGANADSAKEKNDIGFNKWDTQFGRDLCLTLSTNHELTDKQWESAHAMLWKYRAQLSSAGITLPEVTTQKKEKQGFIVRRDAAKPGFVAVQSPYDKGWVERIKALRVRKWDVECKVWFVGIECFDDLVRELIAHQVIDATVFEGDLADKAQAARAGAATLWDDEPLPVIPVIPATPQGTVTLDGDTLIITSDYDTKLVAVCRAADGRWQKGTHQWKVPAQFAGMMAAIPWLVWDEAAAARRDSQQDEAVAVNEARKEIIARYDAMFGDTLPGNPNISLYSHQRRAARFWLNAGNTIFAMDLGTGKTLSALSAAAATGLHIICIVPVTLKQNWAREARWCGIPDDRITILSWHHGAMPVVFEMDDKGNQRARATFDRPFVLIADEVHRAKNLAALRTKALMALAASPHCQGTVLLTGTPMINGRPAELFPLLRMTGHPIARNKRKFDARYCAGEQTRFGYQANGASNLDELRQQTANVLFRITKAQCLDLPEKTRVFAEAEISKEQQDAYDVVYHQLQADYKARVAAGTINAADALVMVSHARHASAQACAATSISTAQDLLDGGQQIVIFTEFKDTGRQIAAALGGEFLSGGVKEADRDPMVQRFQSGETRALVCTFKAGGVGITLTAGSYVILNDRPWTPGETVQAEDRLHRIGQKGAVTSIWIQSFEIQHKIDEVLLTKQEKIDAFMGDTDTLGAASMALQLLRDLFKNGH